MMIIIFSCQVFVTKIYFELGSWYYPQIYFGYGRSARENVLACRGVVLSGCRISNMFCVRGIVTDVGVR